ncbi:MAG: alanine:cation symporter family protein [Acidobacteria bacterium]|nr:alanine:cation symporter family protein [Acidobacteriota bacterium]
MIDTLEQLRAAAVAFLDRFLAAAVDIAWGPGLIVLLLGGGLFLTIRARFIPLRRAGHALEILRGRYDQESDPGQLTHFQALSTALAATIGLGNIGGVAIAITQGGPGAVFWMWCAAFVGMATKYFSCTLAILYRGPDSAGEIQGGPMYFIEHGLGPRFRFLAVFFSACGLIGCLAIFQSNQVAGILRQAYEVPGWVTGAFCLVGAAAVSLGGIRRVGRVTSRIVPAMCLLYLVACLAVLLMHAGKLPQVLAQIFHDAFTGTAAAGGAAGIAFSQVVKIGVKRGVFSNEAGLGTAAMAHGAARTKEPVREGLVAMLGPFIDTIVVCSLTAFVILSTGLWQGVEGVEGVTLTIRAFESSLGASGRLLLVAAAVLFGFSTMIGYSYYGRKCFGYLFGAQRARIYDAFYLGMLFVGAIWSASSVVNLIDTAYALMALPNMIAVLWLSPKVMVETRAYFSRLRQDRP